MLPFVCGVTFSLWRFWGSAAAAEYRQSHPIALAILRAADARELALPRIEDSAYEIGCGIQVTLDNQRIR